MYNGEMIVEEPVESGNMLERFIRPTYSAFAQHCQFRRIDYRDRTSPTEHRDEYDRRQHDTLYQFLAFRLHGLRGSLLVPLLNDELPKTWIFSDPLRSTRCQCPSREYTLSIYATEESVAARRQREIVQFATSLYHRHRRLQQQQQQQQQESTMTTTRLLFELLRNCQNTRDMCSVMTLCGLYRRDENSWRGLLVEGNEDGSNCCGCSVDDDADADAHADADDDYDDDGSPLERMIRQIVTRYDLEIFSIMLALSGTLMERRGRICDVEFAIVPACSMAEACPRMEMPRASPRYAELLQHWPHRVYLHGTTAADRRMHEHFRQYQRLRIGCAMNEADLRAFEHNPVVTEPLRAFLKPTRIDDDLGALYGTEGGCAVTPSPQLLGDSLHATIRLPDFAARVWRRDIWRALPAKAFARITRTIWQTVIPFYRPHFDSFENIALCDKVRCEHGSRLADYRSRLYKREICHLRSRLGLDDGDSSPPPRSQPQQLQQQQQSIDMSTIVDLEARFRSVRADELEFVAPSYQSTIQAMRDFADWNSVWFLVVLFDRILDDLVNYHARSTEENDSRWHEWRELLRYALRYKIRHAVAPLHVFFRHDELRELLLETAAAAAAAGATAAVATTTTTTTTRNESLLLLLLLFYFHADYLAAFEWSVVDAARNGDLVPVETYRHSDANRRVYRDIAACMERARAKVLWGKDNVVDYNSVRCRDEVPAVAPLLELSLRKCFERGGLTDRAALRLPVYREYARAMISRIRDYYVFDALLLHGGGPTCYDITMDVSRRLVAAATTAATATATATDEVDAIDDADLATARTVLAEYRKTGESLDEAKNHVLRKERCCWRPFLTDESWYGRAPNVAAR